MAVSLGFPAVQCVLDHGTAHQRGGKRVLGFKGLSRCREQMIGIPVQLIRSRHHDPCRAVMAGPANQKADCCAQVGMAFSNVECLFLGLDVIEVGEQLQVLAKAARAEGLLEPVPQM